MPAILHVTEGPDSGRLFTLATDQVTIGRNAENTIVLNDTAVSGVHSKIQRDEQGGFTIHDISSTNGTFVNGREQRAADLRHGDTIRIGSTTMTFEVRQHSRRIRGGSEDEAAVQARDPEAVLFTAPKVELAGVGLEELQQSYRNGVLLGHLDKVLAGLEGASEILTAVLDAALAATRARQGIILLVDAKSGEMVPSVVRSLGPIDEVTFSKSLAFEVLHSEQAHIGPDPLAPAGGPVACLPVPTTSNKQAIIYLTDFERGQVDAREEALLLTIARRAGLGLSATRWRVDFELLFSSMIDAIMNTIQAKDVYTRGHSERVRHYSKLLAKELGLKGEELYRVTLGAGLHDIGKVGMPDSVLKHNKSPILTDDQMKEVKKHPVRGARILGDITFLKDVIPAAELHHEDWNGGGYPHGLKGEEIPLIARIVAVADTYDAITTDRPYQKGKSYEEGLAILKKLKGKRLDPDLVELFDAGWHRYRKAPTRSGAPRPERPTNRFDLGEVREGGDQPKPAVSLATQLVEPEAAQPAPASGDQAAPQASPAGKDPPDPDVDDTLSQIIQIG